ncbi:nucleotidyltransferase domain-containing protein [Dictyobacter formicarum]|uniref:DNA polymerase subunit beta n=1 Tax=Dictyobacter formicarum TaxID=2778368 RepID=A0ABQ3VV34_9CHLR|nr:nucleotidyltransferase domain-containing protein [Dictyobacter formicarum]GHO89683.1 DNA polymerase subunit beta [Dictyobacter formicarum]
MLYQDLLQEIIEEARQQEEIIGILLTGSVARGDALPGSDLDLRFILTPGLKREFQSELRQGVLVEQGYADVASAQSKLEADAMQVYAYLDGRILFDPQGVLAQLREQAQKRFETYRISEQERAKIITRLEAARLKIQVAFKAGHLLKAAFVSGTVSWQIIEGLWAANNRPLPPNSSIWPHLKDLTQGPPDVEEQLKQLFCAETPQRIQVTLNLLDWILSQLDSEKVSPNL